jgi:hypothetical protein
MRSNPARVVVFIIKNGKVFLKRSVMIFPNVFGRKNFLLNHNIDPRSKSS